MGAECARWARWAARCAASPTATSSAGTTPAPDLRKSTNINDLHQRLRGGSEPEGAGAPRVVENVPAAPASKSPRARPAGRGAAGARPARRHPARGRSFLRPSEGYNGGRMSPLPHRPVRRRSRLTIALAVSLGVHLLLLPWIAKDAVFHVPAQVRRTAVGLVATPRSQVQHAQRGPPNSAPSAGRSSPDLSPQLPPALEQEKVKQPEKMEGQVVALGEPKDERPPDKPTKYLSEHDSRVLKETRAKETSAFFKNALSKVQREGKNEAANPKKEAAADRK